MMSQTKTDFCNIGDLVRMEYKTGEYIGQVFDRTSTKTVVQILAVLRHPEQGDLHNPYVADVPMFHQRKALSYHERALVTSYQMSPWNGEVPEYRLSLENALEEEIRRMQGMPNKAWAERALAELQALKVEYKQQLQYTRQ